MNISNISGHNIPQKHNIQSQRAQIEETSWFSDWINDKDKVCTDGIDDASISFTEGLESFGKGLLGGVKAFVKHPIATSATVIGGVALVAATGGQHCL